MPLSNCVNLLGRAPTASSLQIGNVDGPSSSTDNALVRWNGTNGRDIQNGVTTEADFTGNLTGGTDQSTTTAVGIGYGNQPANDGVELVSDSALDVQTATVIGTTTGVDTVVVEAVVLTGTTPVATVKTDWGIILAIKLSSAAVGTITVREASADQTITTLAPAATSSGVTTVTNTAAYNRAVSVVADGATTKQIGFGGTNSSGVQIYDSQALTGATAVTSNSSFLTLTEIYRGDLEVARTVTVTTNGGWVLTGGGGGTLTFNTLNTGLTANGNLTFGTAGSILSGTTGSQGITVTGTTQTFSITGASTVAVPSGVFVVGASTTGSSNLIGAFHSTAVNTGIAVGDTVGVASLFYLLRDANGNPSIWSRNSQALAFYMGVTQVASFTATTGNFSLATAYIGSTSTLSGPGACNVTTETTKVTTTGVLDALTLADGVDGQIKRVIHDVDGGSFVLTPTTRTGWSTYTSTAAGESISMQFVTTRGWIIIGSYAGVIA